MDSTRNRLRSMLVAALLMLLTSDATVPQSPRGDRKERGVSRLDPIDLQLGERRLVDVRLVERIRCQGGILTVRPFGRTALVECTQHVRPLER
jgi:hypothetical protein